MNGLAILSTPDHNESDWRAQNFREFPRDVSAENHCPAGFWPRCPLLVFRCRTRAKPIWPAVQLEVETARAGGEGG